MRQRSRFAGSGRRWCSNGCEWRPAAVPSSPILPENGATNSRWSGPCFSPCCTACARVARTVRRIAGVRIMRSPASRRSIYTISIGRWHGSARSCQRKTRTAERRSRRAASRMWSRSVCSRIGATCFPSALRPLADQGDADAQARLAAMFIAGQGVPQDYAEAAKWFRKAADQGSAIAQFGVAAMYIAGRGVPQDHAEAVRWLRKAADQGDTIAQCLLGHAYATGQGVPQDDVDAMKWPQKAADRGNAVGQCLLGVKYSAGAGTPPDFAEAGKWFRRAADQGNAAAQAWLA